MLIFIVFTLSIVLDLAFRIAKSLIIGKYTFAHFSVNLSFSLIELLPLLVPCIYAEQVCGEVRILKDLISSRLYENTLDKSSRSSARSLLTLIETRNLSFSLFHMFDIDIALPFKFLGLLLTYLIIMLQFDKVINPD
nr:uncharacterized protein LOC113400400 [Vanessa tameamea]